MQSVPVRGQWLAVTPFFFNRDNHANRLHVCLVERHANVRNASYATLDAQQTRQCYELQRETPAHPNQPVGVDRVVNQGQNARIPRPWLTIFVTSNHSEQQFWLIATNLTSSISYFRLPSCHCVAIRNDECTVSAPCCEGWRQRQLKQFQLTLFHCQLQPGNVLTLFLYSTLLCGKFLVVVFTGENIRPGFMSSVNSVSRENEFFALIQPNKDSNTSPLTVLRTMGVT